MININRRFGCCLTLCAILGAPALALAASNSDLAKKAQNPVADLISLPLQNNTNFDWGVDGEAYNVLNIQPVYPVKLNDDWNLITRTILPVVSQPARVDPAEGRENGLGNTTFTAFLSPRGAGGGLTWGAGPVIVLPTATDDRLGGDSWGAGLSAVALQMSGKWVYGGLVSQVWDIGGSNKAADQIDLLTIQPFVNYNLDDGWYLTAAPIWTRNGEAASGEKWTVPVGGGFGKVFRAGKLPLNFNTQLYYNAVRQEQPVDVGRWQLRLQIQALFPK